MFATKLHRVVMGSAARTVMLRASTPSVTMAWNRGFATTTSKTEPSNTDNPSFSTMANSQPRGVVERPLKVLDLNIVRKIKAELMEVDANSDGR